MKKANKLLCFAIPLMVLGGCGTNSSADKPKDKVEAKQETKEKLSKDLYPTRMTGLSSELMGKIATITELAMDKNKDEKTLTKEILKEEENLQKIIKKFHQIEPPKEYADAHKTILKGVDCYSEAYAKQAKIAKDGSTDKETAKDLMQKIKEGNDYMVEGYKPLQEANIDKANSISDKTGVKFDTPTTKSDTKADNGSEITISEEGSEWYGSWGRYDGTVFHKALEFREDHTFTGFDDTGKAKAYEDNHMTGEWYYNADEKKLKLYPKEFVKDGKTYSKNEMRGLVPYTVKSFTGNSFEIVDDKGTAITAVKKK
ncbi:protein of unknown function [Bacillus sp. 491mf]|uniref:DUF7018 domain-containing (lipo)protein n=1 Tax=Bacillus sp. 491mf TaxID=1761755 RepID=UPI0008E6432E|nr:hypothetical protein [Bacillus sp. 491mf]SFC82176.1 protein of unknown function [Bacillus sp. 491mf]